MMSRQIQWKVVPWDKEKAWAAIFRENDGCSDIPSGCPICGTRALHRYYIQGNEERHLIDGQVFVGRGALWEWCSHCRHYVHYSGSASGSARNRLLWRPKRCDREHCGDSMMKAAGIHLKDSSLYINSYAKTTSGLWIDSSTRIKLPIGSDCHAKGEAVISALDASREGVPHPTEWKAVARPLLELAGARSWNAFAKGALYLGVESDDATLEFTPSRNLGPKGGFEPINDKALKLQFPLTAEQIGGALEEGLKLCEK